MGEAKRVFRAEREPFWSIELLRSEAVGEPGEGICNGPLPRVDIVCGVQYKYMVYRFKYDLQGQRLGRSTIPAVRKLCYADLEPPQCDSV